MNKKEDLDRWELGLSVLRIALELQWLPLDLVKLLVNFTLLMILQGFILFLFFFFFSRSKDYRKWEVFFFF